MVSLLPDGAYEIPGIDPGWRTYVKMQDQTISNVTDRDPITVKAGSLLRIYRQNDGRSYGETYGPAITDCSDEVTEIDCPVAPGETLYFEWTLYVSGSPDQNYGVCVHTPTRPTGGFHVIGTSVRGSFQGGVFGADSFNQAAGSFRGGIGETGVNTVRVRGALGNSFQPGRLVLQLGPGAEEVTGLIALLRRDVELDFGIGILNSSDWDYTISADVQVGSSRLKHFGDGLLFYAKTALQNSDSRLFKSTDSGETFTVLSTGPSRQIEVVRGFEGRLWLLGDNNSGSPTWTPQVHYSDDDGATWTLAYTHGSQHAPYSIAASRANGNHIAFTHRNGTTNPGTEFVTEDRYLITYSSNGGSSWSTGNLPQHQGDQGVFDLSEGFNYLVNRSMDACPLVIGSDGTVVVFVPRGGGTPLFFSQDPGAIYKGSGSSWTAKYTFDVQVITQPPPVGDIDQARGSPIQMVADGNNIFALSDWTDGSNVMVLISTDFGDTWRTVGPPSGWVEEETFAESMVYDGLTDTLYVMDSYASSFGEVFALANATAGGSSWSQVQTDTNIPTVHTRGLSILTGAPD